MDPRGFPTSLPEFQRAFPTDAACLQYLEQLRWPQGFVCPKCAHQGEPYRFTARKSPVVVRCRACLTNVSLTAGTVMEKTHTPLSTWFWAAYLVTTQTPGISALQFQRQLGLTRYETAFQLLHKLRAGMIRPNRDRIGGPYPVEVDETFLGGRTRGEGRGVHHKAVVLGAVEVRTRKGAANDNAGERDSHKNDVPLKRNTYAGRLRLRVVSARRMAPLTKFVRENVAQGSLVRTDGFSGYEPLSFMGFNHMAVVMNDDPKMADEHLPMIHLIFSNLKTWLLGTHHGVSQDHLQAYLNEYVFRFNRRFYPMSTFHSVLGIAAHQESPTYEELYSGAWVHAA